MIPFLLACVILACNQATGVNSIIGYNATILIQAGCPTSQAHWGYVILTLVNFLMTMVGVMLVDRKGRKFLLSLGSAGIIVSLICTGCLFHQTENLRVDAGDAVQAMVGAGPDVPTRWCSDERLLAERSWRGDQRSHVADHHLFLRRFPRGDQGRAFGRQDGEAD